MAGKDSGNSGMHWYVRHGSVVRGPFSSNRVRHLVLEGELQIDDQVSVDKKIWNELRRVPEVVPPEIRGQAIDYAAEHDADQRRENHRALRSLSIVVVLIAALVGTVIWLNNGSAEEPRDCSAVPAPHLLLESCQLAQVNWTGAVLTGARMANSSLPSAHLSQADLSTADLRYANLNGADLSYAELSQSVLKGADLRFADLSNADLSGANLSFADLTGARLGGAKFANTDLEGAIWVDGSRCTTESCPRGLNP